MSDNILTEEHSAMAMNAISFAADGIAYEFKNLAIQKQELVFVEALNPKITKDGDMWCVLYGEDLQEGIAGFGETPMRAILEFNKAMVSP